MQNLLELIQEENKEFAWNKENYSFENFEKETPVKIKFVPLLDQNEDQSDQDCQKWALFESSEFPSLNRKGRSLIILKVPAILKKLCSLIDLKAMFY